MTDAYSNDAYKEELAFGYVHGLLGPEEKKQVFDLILSDPAFTELVREELLLARSMQTYRSELPPLKKQELLRRIKDNAGSGRKAIVTAALKAVLKVTMPPVAYRTLITFKGDVWA